MKLFYWKSLYSSGRNFGDDLNPWLWDALLPGILDDDDSELFVGIGTLLNGRLPTDKLKVIFGTGAGYGDVPKVDEKWRIYCVRGPLTARALGIAPELAVSDAAMLVPKVYSPPRVEKKFQFSYMPHWNTASSDWKGICESLGFGYIDPRASVTEVLDGVVQTEVLIAEAMHGAIVADALRIPWVPVASHAEILQFKWEDWCSSIGIRYAPESLLPLWSEGAATPTGITALHGRLKRRFAKRQLRRISLHARPNLSSDTRLTQVVECLEEKLEQFRGEMLRRG